MKQLALLLIVYPCMAETPSPDTEASFHGTCEISGIRSASDGTTATWSDRCSMETTPNSNGLRNLVRVLVSLSAGSPVATDLAPIADYVKSQSTLSGTIVITSALWGKITVSPAYQQIRDSIAARAPAFEIRPQSVSVSLLDSATLEIRIEERWDNYDGGKPSSAWQSRCIDSYVLLSHSK